MTSSQILRPTRDFLQTHLHEPDFFFGFTSDAFRKRPVSSYQDSYVNFYEEIYERRWYRKWTTYCVSGEVMRRVPQASLQADSALTRHHSRSLRIPEEQDDCKKRDVEQSAPTHARHTHCTPMQLGTTADQSMTFLRTDIEKHAIWQRIH